MISHKRFVTLQPMRIVYFFRSLALWGGIERIIVDKAGWLAGQEDCQVTIVTCDQGNHEVPYALADGVALCDLDVGLHRQYRYRGWRRLWERWQLERLLAKRLRRKIAELQADVVVCVATSYADTVLRAVGDRVPVVVESHSIYSQMFGRGGIRGAYNDWRLQRQLKRARMVVTLTEDDARDWRRLLPEVRCIPNMVEQNPTGRMGDAATRRVIFVGRFDYQKRAEMAIGLWQRVGPQHPDWQLHVYGDGERREAVAEAARRVVGVTLHKPTASIFDAYCDSAFLILTSLYEPFGLVMAEAMSCGLPVVAFDCPYGPRTIVEDGSNGFLVEEGDMQGFADSMSRLMDDDALCRRMGSTAVMTARRFSANQVMPQWLTLFHELTEA